MNPPSPNVQFSFVAERNPWETLKDDFPRLHPAGAWILSLFVIAAAAYHPLLSPPVWFSIALLIGCALLLIAVVRSPIVTIACGLLLFVGYLLGGMGGPDGFGLPLATMAVAQVCAVGVGAYLIAVCRSYALLAIPVLAYGATLVLCGDPLLSLLSLLPFPAAGILAYHTMENHPRVGTIALSSLIGLLCTAFGVALWYNRSVGAISWNELAVLLEDLRAGWINKILNTPEAVEWLTDYLKAESSAEVTRYVTALVEMFFNLLPALVITLFNAMAYAAQRLCICAFRATGLGALVTTTARYFHLSVLSALIFLISSLIFLFRGTATVFTSVACNLWLILLPGMLIVGIQKLITDLRGGVSRLWLFILIGTVLFAPYVLLYCLSISGAIQCLLRPLMARLLLKGGFPPDGPTGGPQA